jgi:virginiamycin B lyase
MIITNLKYTKFLLLSLMLLLMPGLVEADRGDKNLKVDIEEWQVPWKGTRPRDPYTGPKELVWFVGQTGDYVASFNPDTGDFKRFDLESGTGPHNLIVAEDGTVWYAGNLAAHIGKLNVSTGKITTYPMPDPKARDPHTLVFDGKGHIWFTVQMGNFVGRLTMENGNVDLIKIPTSYARPYGIVVDSHARPWVVELGSNKLATVDPETLQVREIELPRKEARPRRLGITSDGHIWYVDYAKGYLGRYSPGTGQFVEWQTPSADRSGPYGLAVDHRDRIWFVETWQHPNKFVGFDSTTETFISVTPIPSGGGSVRHMHFNPETHEIWFGTDTNNLGRVTAPE